MQLLKIRSLSFLIFILLFAHSTSAVSALAPHIVGKVVNRDTGEGIPGMVIKWEDNAAAKSEFDENGVRYTITQADGSFRFASWHMGPDRQGLGTESLREAERDAMIDTDYNGSPDQQRSSTSEGGYFGCVESPHTFSLMLPRPGMDGTFEPTRIVTDINNGDYVHDIGTFYYQPVVPRCPGNVRLRSCDIVNSTATVAWDAPPGNVDGYKVYFDQEPFNVLSDGDVLHPLMSNILQRTQRITLDKRYIVRAKTLRTVDGRQLESESCLAEFVCESDCIPGSTGCPEEPTATMPTGTLTGALCPAKPNDFFYDFTLNNINIFGQQFVDSRMMLVFYLNEQTQEIMDFLNGNPQGPPYTSTADFSQWKERNITAQQGHYFGYFVQTFNQLPANNTLTFRLNDSTRIGTKTIGQLREFLEENNYRTQYVFKANMSTRTSSGGDLFNSHIPLPGAGTIDLARTQDNICRGTGPVECELGTCPTINITSPDANATVQPVSNRITVTWTSSNPAIDEFHVLVYDTDVYDAATANTEYESAIAAGRAPVKVRRYTATTTTRQVNVSGLSNAIGIAVRGIVPTPQCSETPAPIPPLCNWNERDVSLGYTVTGRFYLDNQCTSTNVADEIPITGQISANGETIQLNADRSYSFNLPFTGPQDIVLQIGGTDFICATESNLCPARVSSNTCRIDDVTGPGVRNFYVQTSLSQFKSWWQVRGGLVYGNNGITSNLPFDSDGNTTCDEPFCKPFLLRRELTNSGEKTAGIPMTNTGGFSSIISGWWTDRADNDKGHTEGTNNLMTGELKEDSGYFKKLLTNKVTPRTSPGTISSLPTDSRTVVQDAEVWHYTGDLTIRPTSTWNVSNKQVIIVDGNIRFETEGLEQLITVSRGGFLAFISSRDIIIDNEVGASNANVSDTQSNIEGVYIADGVLRIEGNGAGGDKKFIGAGTFVGWNDVVLQRRFDNPSDPGDTTNQLKNTNMPVESFFYRPDFAVNAPEFMRSASYTWKEVN